MASMKARRFSSSASTANDFLPVGACTMPLLSTRNSIFPAFSSLTARATSMVTVPALGLGMSPRGPNTLPSGPSCPMTSGVATMTSVSSQPSLIFCTYSMPTKSAPAASASFAFSPCAITSTRTFLPVPCGRLTVPRTIWSACLGSTPRRTAMSTDSSNLAYAVAFTFPPLRAGCRAGGARASRRRPGSACRARASVHHLQAHRASRAGHHFHSGVQVVRVQIGHLDLGDLFQLRARDLPHLLPVGGGGPLLNAGFLLEEHGGRGRLGNEGEGPVLVDRHLDRRDHPLRLGRLGIELLDELHDVHAVRPQGRADRRGGGRLPGGHLELHHCSNRLRHLVRLQL